MLRRRRPTPKEAELNITSFMNLMIILVPVLLMSMVFARTTVLDLNLPDLAVGNNSENDEEKKQLEVVIRADYIDVNYPAGTRLKRILKKEVAIEQGPNSNAGAVTTARDADSTQPLTITHDFQLLTLVLKEVKRRLRDSGTEKRDVTLLSEPDTSYQTIVSAMDAIRSYKTVVVTSVVDAELFPDVSLGDAPSAPTGDEAKDQSSRITDENEAQPQIAGHTP